MWRPTSRVAQRESARPASGGHARQQRTLTHESTHVRFVRSIHIPEDELCFFVFDAPSGRDAALAAERADIDPIRVVEAVSSRKEEP